MNLLVIDTTGPACSVALRCPDRADLIVSEQMARGQAERLAPMTQEILASAGLRPPDIDRVGVTTGPGSFAGTRVGVAFARGLALATGAECVGVSCLQWWASGVDPAINHPVIAVHDARRGELVIQSFTSGKALDAPLTLSIDAAQALLLEQLESGAPVEALNLIGSGARFIFPAEEGAPVDFNPELVDLLDLVSNLTPPFNSPRPFYARPPDAKLPGGVSA
ncbi:MAG: tRNA (adenosine(37)-N6)-threonylcarbamoyltransferase complex dimerization subunit type 1 TsaB [Hyphobacterium sp.]|nr:MAG: tRNA (adenosine(37)-N6)-threonylcarbamoyltransferase complex dimerization subunit type 1 TsaB [Hyphobacterium sp.]